VTAARALALGALAVALVVVAVVLLGGNGGTEYKLRFQNAGQLVNDNDVQVGGRRIGKVTDIELTDNNQALVTVEVEDDFAPLHEGTRAVIRLTSLSGVANRYINLTPGPNNAPELEEGAELTADETTSPVDLDQLFAALDDRTRKGLQELVQGFATQYDGAADFNNRAARYFNPALSTSRRFVNELVRDREALRALLRNGAKVSAALAERDADLTDLVSNANATNAAIASEREAFERDLSLLAPTLRRANTTFVNLRATLGDLDVLVEESKPVAPELAPFFRALRPLVRDARPTIKDLRLLIRRKGSENDLVELLRKTPKLARVARPAFANTTEALRKQTPVLSFIRPYTPDLVGWFRDFGQSTSNYDANGHYARIQPIFNAFTFTDNPAGGVLTPNPGLTGNVFEGLTTGNVRRCPGAAVQAQPDGSNPFRDSDGNLDCDPRIVPPGP
jgi:phospholipid/cholesterol/gamma-HCH transport system substrate-binding protein